MFYHEVAKVRNFRPIFDPFLNPGYVLKTIIVLHSSKVRLYILILFIINLNIAIFLSADASAYPKLHKIYNELSNQNGIIFDAERERNAIEGEINNLKGIAKRYSYQTVHDLYRAYNVSGSAYADYQENDAKWEKLME